MADQTLFVGDRVYHVSDGPAVLGTITRASFAGRRATYQVRWDDGIGDNGVASTSGDYTFSELVFLRRPEPKLKPGLTLQLLKDWREALAERNEASREVTRLRDQLQRAEHRLEEAAIRFTAAEQAIEESVQRQQ